MYNLDWYKSRKYNNLQNSIVLQDKIKINESITTKIKKPKNSMQIITQKESDQENHESNQ